MVLLESVEESQAFMKLADGVVESALVVVYASETVQDLGLAVPVAKLPENVEALLEGSDGLVQTMRFSMHVSEAVQRIGDPIAGAERVPELAEDAPCLVKGGDRVF
jgi:hypothetical protein